MAYDSAPTCRRNVSAVADAPLFAFLHLPRTGGTTIREEFLAHAFLPEEIYFVFEHANFPDGVTGGPIDGLGALSPARRQRLLGVAGHMPPELDRHFPDRAIRYFTFLRDPVERDISTYFYCRREVDNPAHPYAVAMSAADFIEAGFGGARNGMTHYLAGTPWGARHATGEGLLEAALGVLDRCFFLGLDTTYEADLAALRSIIGGPAAGTKVVNSARRDRPVSADERSRIAVANALDMRLYERALSLRAQHGGPLLERADPAPSALALYG